MTGTNIISDRTETRLRKIILCKWEKREGLRDEIFEIVKEIVSVVGGRERDGVHCEQQIVGALVVEVAQVPGALLFHGSHSLSEKTGQPCRQLCSRGCRGERRGGERREHLLLIPVNVFVFLHRPVVYSSLPNCFCLFHSSGKVPYRKTKVSDTLYQYSPFHSLHLYCILPLFVKSSHAV